MDAAERGVRAAAIAALGIIGGEGVGLFDVAWATVGSVAAGAAVVSLLMSTVAGSGGDPTTAGFTTSTRWRCLRARTR
ncbi:holin [Nonomuraea sp. bgisy101]|uniref:holin n=1 Tax=Nonomuraea sp. bgisy101 TaxID=3413784 RepID=UPI003D70BBA7